MRLDGLVGIGCVTLYFKRFTSACQQGYDPGYEKTGMNMDLTGARLALPPHAVEPWKAWISTTLMSRAWCCHCTAKDKAKRQVQEPSDTGHQTGQQKLLVPFRQHGEGPRMDIRPNNPCTVQACSGQPWCICAL